MKKMTISLALFLMSVAAPASVLKSYECYKKLQTRPYVKKVKAVCWKGKDSAIIQTYISVVGIDDPFRKECTDEKAPIHVAAGYVALHAHQKLRSGFDERADLPFFGLQGKSPYSRSYEIETISRKRYDSGGAIDRDIVNFNFLTRSGETKKIRIDFTNEVGSMFIDNEEIEFDGCQHITD